MKNRILFFVKLTLAVFFAVNVLPVHAESPDSTKRMYAVSEQNQTLYLNYLYRDLEVAYEGVANTDTTWTSSNTSIINVAGNSRYCRIYVQKKGGPVTVTARSKADRNLYVNFTFNVVEGKPDDSAYTTDVSIAEYRRGYGTFDYTKNPDLYNMVYGKSYTINVLAKGSSYVPSNISEMLKLGGMSIIAHDPNMGGGGMAEGPAGPYDRAFGADFTVKTLKVGKETMKIFNRSTEIRVLFSDVADESKYFYDPVYWAFDNEITVGAGGPGKFSPNASCTREQFVTFLWRLKGQPKAENGCDFADVPKDEWYYEPIAWAAEKGITTGLNDGTNRFGVGQPCTREQCVTFLYRADGEPAEGQPVNFRDVEEGKYYYNAISWASYYGITKGVSADLFGVGQKCSRGMLVTFLYRSVHHQK